MLQASMCAAGTAVWQCCRPVPRAAFWQLRCCTASTMHCEHARSVAYQHSSQQFLPRRLLSVQPASRRQACWLVMLPRHPVEGQRLLAAVLRARLCRQARQRSGA